MLLNLSVVEKLTVVLLIIMKILALALAYIASVSAGVIEGPYGSGSAAGASSIMSGSGGYDDGSASQGYGGQSERRCTPYFDTVQVSVMPIVSN